MTFKTLVIFDWDNTLFPSTFLASNSCTLLCSTVPTSIQEQISKLEQNAISIITTAQQHGQVAIITNAESTWVELSCHKYFPNLFPILESITIISAQTTFKPYHPNDPTQWKLLAFEKLINDNPHINHIVSIGDSDYEHDACRHIAKTNPNITTKLIKLTELPSIDIMYLQMSLIIKAFTNIHERIYHTELSIISTII